MPMIRGSFEERSGCIGLVLAPVAIAAAAAAAEADVVVLVIRVVGPDGDAGGDTVVVLSILLK